AAQRQQVEQDEIEKGFYDEDAHGSQSAIRIPQSAINPRARSASTNAAASRSTIGRAAPVCSAMQSTIAGSGRPSSSPRQMRAPIGLAEKIRPVAMSSRMIPSALTLARTSVESFMAISRSIRRNAGSPRRAQDELRGCWVLGVGCWVLV